MLKKAGLEFGRALADLRALELSCELARHQLPNAIYDDTGFIAKSAFNVLGNLKRVCILSDLDDAVAEIDRFGPAISGRVKIEDVKGRATALREHLYHVLDQEYYFQIAREDIPFYGQKAPFGLEVAKRFKAASTDLEAAGNCLALQQSTACVFHLMRGMEVAVRHLSKRLKVTIAPQTTWRQMTGQMDDKIKKMPEKTAREKEKKHDWEAARANLHHVGSVWRNKTMHPAESYTRGQARDVFGATRVFMQGLSEL